jgi:hypothetical protein
LGLDLALNNRHCPGLTDAAMFMILALEMEIFPPTTCCVSGFARSIRTVCISSIVGCSAVTNAGCEIYINILADDVFGRKQLFFDISVAKKTLVLAGWFIPSSHL